MTQVVVGLAQTHNTGNFESLKLNVEIGDDVRKDETVKDAINRIYKTVESALNEKSLEALGETTT